MEVGLEQASRAVPFSFGRHLVVTGGDNRGQDSATKRFKSQKDWMSQKDQDLGLLGDNLGTS